MKVKAALLFLCGIVSVGAGPAVKAAKPASVHYELTLKSLAFGNMGTRKMWIKGNNMRFESKSARLPLVLIRNDEGVFLVHPWAKMVAKYPAGSDRGNPKAMFPGPSGPMSVFVKKVNAKKHGTETVSRQRCDLYIYTDPITKRESRIWVNAKTGKPVQLLLKGVKGKVDTITATYTVYEPGAKVADTMFQLPKGYKVRPMPESKLTSKARKPIAKQPG